jgi:hypothetical protein
MKQIFTKSDNFKEEYCATIVKVGELKDIENSDNLKQAIIDGFSVVVNKNDVNEGDYMIYCKNETELNSQFLSVNNMYEIGERERNANHAEVEKLIGEGKNDEAKKMVGYFNKNGRVKMIRLRGCPSMGVLMRFESFINWDSELADINLADYVKYDENGNFIPFDFDTINDKLFIKAYVPKTNPVRSGGGSGKRKNKIKRFDRMLDGEFAFHYDTSQLNSNMWRLNPETVVDVSVKVHGTSFVMGNILVKKPTLMNKIRDFINGFKDRKISRYDRSINYYNKMLRGDVATNMSEEFMLNSISDLEKRIAKIENSKLKNFATEYYNVYSSRTVIKNRYINKQVNSGFYSVDIWGEYNDLLKGKIPENITIYGEIVGYITGSDKMIQKGYDYGCEPGTNKLMIYRVNEKMEDGTHKEYEISEVINFTNNLVDNFPDISDRILPYQLLYHGKLSDLYPTINSESHWHENALEAMKSDKEHFGMELNEPLCNNKVPREGICLRIANDPVKECFKLKCLKFLKKESEDIDKGVVDIEMADNYGEN